MSKAAAPNRYSFINRYRREVLSKRGPRESSTKLLLVALAERADGSCVCWPSQKQLAEDTGLDIRTIRHATRRARRGRWVSTFDSKRAGRVWKYTTYMLHLPDEGIGEDKNAPTLEAP